MDAIVEKGGGIRSSPTVPPVVPDNNFEIESTPEDLTTESSVEMGGVASLPHPEEVKGMLDENYHGSGRTKKKMALMGSIFLFIIIFPVLVVVVLRPGDGTRPFSLSSSGDSEASRSKAVMDLLVNKGISTHDKLTDTSTPQFKAAAWIADLDYAMRPIPPIDGDDNKIDKFVQRYILAVVYYCLGGEGWLDHLQFLSWRDECNWIKQTRTKDGQVVNLGVICSESVDPDESGRVEKILMPWNFNLTGNLPEEMGHLTYLRSVSMSYNNIRGTIPASLGKLKQLEELGLSNNILSGTVPHSFGGMDRLETLSLDDNALTGSILMALNSMIGLKYAYLENNMFSGNIGDLKLFGLSSLEQLDLSSNAFTGELTSVFFNHPTMEVLDLNNNDVRGRLPDTFGGDTDPAKLNYVALHNNKLTGTIPSGLAHLTDIVFLDFSHNQFTGKVPSSLGGMTKLECLFLGANDFAPSEFPSFIQNLTNLKELSLKNTSLTGSIPSWIGALGGMYLLDLDGNDLTGSIPPSLGNLTDLYIVMLNRNKLSGHVPESLIDLKALEVLLLDGNNLTGSLDFLCPSPSHPEPHSLKKISWLFADCGGEKIECSSMCCTECCLDGEGGCNDEKWLINNNLIWEHGYTRQMFEFEM